MRAIKGAAEIVKGTMEAVVPIEEPTKRRVRGMIATINIMKGVERVALTIAPKTLFTGALGRIWFLRVTVKITPSGTPMSVASIVEASTI